MKEEDKKYLADPQDLPEPTYWPFLMALGITLGMWWIVSSWILGGIGVVLFFISLYGWINELRAKNNK